MLDLKLDALDEVQTCDTDASLVCFRLEFGSTEARIVRARSGVRSAASVRSVDLTFYVTTADLRRD